MGRTADGQLRYFILPDTILGSFAEHTVIDRRRSVILPDGADPVAIAATMNPAMSSWIALRRRIDFTPGSSVLILGATGNAGRMAIQVARKLGASRVIAAGRGAERLAGLGADLTVSLDGDAHTIASTLGDAGKDVDVVLDYLWGKPTHDALTAIVPRRTKDSQELSWIQIGSVAGTESAIPSAALRATRLQLVGSGQGSVASSDIVAELHDLTVAVSTGVFSDQTTVLPLRKVEQAWNRVTDSSERMVFVP